jgi:DNA-directed RNA polymerase alpha subunit
MIENDPNDEFDELEESVPIQVDVYGIKLSSNPSSIEDASSRITLQELRDDVSQSLLRICRDSIGFLADVFTGSRNFVRGIAALPTAIASRVGRAHRLSEQRETRAQQQFSTPILSEETKAESIKQLEDLLHELRTQGIPVHLDRLSSGQIAISLVRSDLGGVVPQIATDAVAGYIETESPQAAQADRLDEVLNTHITKCDLSLLARDLLQNAGMRTLGDLTRTTETELLASYDFGETALHEVRKLLASKGFEIGQFASEPPDVSSSLDAQLIFDRPLSDLKLSVRARKTMVKLGLSTIGELIRKSADELLESKNFGVASLQEVREKLSQLGLALTNE